MSHTPQHDVIIVGSGPGGATVARDLTRQGKRVLILEWGSGEALKGNLLHMAKIAAIPGRGAYVNRDFSLLVQGVTTGGSSAINFATAMPPPTELFARYGIALHDELAALRQELAFASLPDHLIGPMATRIMHSARSLGLEWHKFDKLIRADTCRTGCWRCLYGCPYGAKWTARDFVTEAIDAGAQLITSAKVSQVLHQDGCANGVVFQHQGQTKVAKANTIILAGGGIASPRLLQASGIALSTTHHFSDPVIAVMGSVDDLAGGAEVPMAAGLNLEQEGITLSDLTLPPAMYRAFAAQVGRFDRWFAHRKTLSIMVKIRDELGGNIGKHWINKRLTPADQGKFKQGIALARDILHHAHAKSIFQTWHFAAHPGGSVRIGDGVDHNLQTTIRQLYVCDASVIPEAWGLPPSLTIICLAKRLAGHLVQSSSMV